MTGPERVKGFRFAIEDLAGVRKESLTFVCQG